MARAQTIFSELAVASSINGGTIDGIKNIDTLDREIYFGELNRRLKTTKGKKQVDALNKAGQSIRNALLSDGSISKLNIEWTGNDKTGSMSTVAKDIHIQNLNLRISVKENADVFINGSAENIFVQLPSGIFGRKVRGEDWFIQTAREELNNYFLLCGGEAYTGSKNIEEYYKTSTKETRKQFGSIVKLLHDTKNISVMGAYALLCEKVSVKSAEIFNTNLSHFIATQKNTSNALQPIFYFFFRINGVKYILAGTEDSKPFAVYMQPGDTCVKRYDFLKIEAIPLQSGQPEVLLRFSFRDKLKKHHFDIDLKIEIRWSHGKFCGNPECKVYKKWKYTDLPWSEPLDIS